MSFECQYRNIMMEGRKQANSNLTQFHTNHFSLQIWSIFISDTSWTTISSRIFSISGFLETILTPLQASTVRFRADQRIAVEMPPLPPITKEQISSGEFKDLLEESNYDLTTMANLYFILAASSMQHNNIPLLITNNFHIYHISNNLCCCLCLMLMQTIWLDPLSQVWMQEFNMYLFLFCIKHKCQ